MDDVHDAARTLSELVIAMGCASTFVTDPREAVRAAVAYQPKAVLLDIGMPYINGYQLAPALREALLPKTVAIIAVTAWGSAKDREHSYAAGFDEHIVKPAQVQALQQVFDKLLG